MVIYMKDKDFPRILVISHNSFSRVLNNGKTLSMIFKGWPEDRIAQLYFYNEVPDFSVCKKFYRITDQDMLFEKKALIGSGIDEDSKKNQNNKKETVYSFLQRGRNSAFLSTLRNIVWVSKKWNSKLLWKWMTNFAPQAVFIACGGSVHPYKIAYEISVTFKIPIFLYFGDDYLLPYFTLDAFRWINWFWLRKAINKILPIVGAAFVICEEMTEAYEEILGNICHVVMTPVDLGEYEYFRDEKRNEPKGDSEVRIAYFGGLHLNRWKSLIRLGEAIKSVTERARINASLSIYSMSSLSKKLMSKIRALEPYVRFAGSVDEKEIIAEMMKYDILVHAESFDPINRHKTRLSISTKIPEYLATGKYLLAIGPKEIASIRYLTRTGSAYVVNSLDSRILEESVLKIIQDCRFKKGILEKNIELAKRNHSSKITREKVLEIISSASEN